MLSIGILNVLPKDILNVLLTDINLFSIELKEFGLQLAFMKIKTSFEYTHYRLAYIHTFYQFVL